MARGGKRTGAGRKKGFAAIEAEEARRVIAELVSKEIVPITKALIKKAKQGDITASKLLLERAFGKVEGETKPTHLIFDMAIDREQYRS